MAQPGLTSQLRRQDLLNRNEASSLESPSRHVAATRWNGGKAGCDLKRLTAAQYSCHGEPFSMNNELLSASRLGTRQSGFLAR